jgi:hypothetical protein
VDGVARAIVANPAHHWLDDIECAAGVSIAGKGEGAEAGDIFAGDGGYGGGSGHRTS